MVALSLIFIITADAVTPIKVGSHRLYVLALSLGLLLLGNSVLIDNLELFNGYLAFNNYRLVLLGVVLIVGILSVTYNSGSLILLSLLGTCFVVTSNHLITMIIALELQSFTSYALAYLSRQNVNEETSGAALKYLLLGALASSFIILGLALIYVNTGVLNYNILMESNIGLVFFLAGLMFKLGVAPFHQWAPDVYGTITNNTIAYLSLTPKIGALALLSSVIWSQNTCILLVSSLTIIVGSIGGLIQIEYRRLLAYSSISHIGYLLLAATIASHSVVLIYLVQYVVTTLAVLYCFQVLDPNNTGQLKVVANVLQTQPYLAGLLGILLFSLAGVPPFVGFFAKFQVFSSIIAENYYLMTFVAIITSIIGAFYYLQIMITMLTTTSSSITAKISINSLSAFYLICSVAFIVFAVLEGNLFLQVAQLMAQQNLLL